MGERKKFKGEKAIFVLAGILTLYELTNVLYISFKGEVGIRSIIEFLVMFTVFTLYYIKLKKEDANFLKVKNSD